MSQTTEEPWQNLGTPATALNLYLQANPGARLGHPGGAAAVRALKAVAEAHAAQAAVAATGRGRAGYGGGRTARVGQSWVDRMGRREIQHCKQVRGTAVETPELAMHARDSPTHLYCAS